MPTWLRCEGCRERFYTARGREWIGELRCEKCGGLLVVQGDDGREGPDRRRGIRDPIPLWPGGRWLDV